WRQQFRWTGRSRLDYLPAGIVATVILTELAGLQRFPPVRVVTVPADGFPQTGLEVNFRLPAEALNPRAIHRIAPVVSLAVSDMPDHLGRGVQFVENHPGNLDIVAFVSAGYVVDLTIRPLAQHQFNPGSMIACMQPVAYLHAVTVQGNRFAFQHIGGGKWQEFLRILIWTVGI